MPVTSDAVRVVLDESTTMFGAGLELAHMAPLNVSCDQLSAIGGYVSREYGDYGYSIEYIKTITSAVTLAQVRHFDGSRFILAADKWANVRRLDNSGTDAMASAVAEMHNVAVTP